MAAGFSVKDALNKNSKAGIDESPRARFRTKDISIFKMYRNDMNFYSVADIEELAGDILLSGLKQNLELVYAPCEKGEYRIVAGERRWEALKYLVSKGYKDFELATSKLTTPQDDDEEQVEIIIANSYRSKTISDMIEEETRLKASLERMKAAGKKIKGYDLQSGRLRDDVWIEKGLVTVTETLGGIKTDYKYIIKYLEDLVKEYDLKPQLICYDPHNASAFLSDLEALGFDSISVTQTAKELNDATVDFRLEILAGNVEIEGIEVGKEGNKIVVPADGLLVWSIANAKTISNNYGEIKIDKDITTERIDPIDAIIDAWKHAMKEEYRPDVNETVNEWLEQFEKYMKKGGEK